MGGRRVGESGSCGCALGEREKVSKYLGASGALRPTWREIGKKGSWKEVNPLSSTFVAIGVTRSIALPSMDPTTIR